MKYQVSEEGYYGEFGGAYSEIFYNNVNELKIVFENNGSESSKRNFKTY